MRLSQPITEKRTWPKHFLALLQETTPDYVLNRAYRGTRTECIRRLPDGLYYSQNTICLHGQYRHGFAVLLSPADAGPYLFSPFFAGGRFNHNYLIADAFSNDLGLGVRHSGRPHGLHSVHEWREGTDDIVRRCTANAERYLPSKYRAFIRAATSELRVLVKVAEEHLSALEDPTFLAKHTGASPRGLDLSLKALATPEHPWYSLPQPQRYLAAVCSKPELFKRQAPFFGEVLATLVAVSAGA